MVHWVLHLELLLMDLSVYSHLLWNHSMERNWGYPSLMRQQTSTNFEGIMHDVRKAALRKYCVSLPELITTGLPSVGGNKVFTFINSDWEKICQDKTFCI
jgi:hypothetical protein